jgi:alkanesulfonate monooxygenase SsuD/methylene tetrahydromethanopterin reductase-like flavin-dependent oxidoreductase (luciferase family)
VTSLGAVCLPQVPPERLCEVVSAADDAGLEELWLWEDCFLTSGIATAAATILTADLPPDRVREACRLVAEGRAVSGRTGQHPVVAYLSAATGPGAPERLEAEQRRSGSVPGAGVAGDARAIADAVHRWADAGADRVILQPTVDEPDPVGFVRFVAREVRPLVPSAG